jgi:multicomponent Na+:H+ antiporter subunit E
MHMAIGFAAALGVAWLNTERSAMRLSMRIRRMLWYFPWLVTRIMQSGFHLSVLILDPALPIDPKLIHYRTELKDDSSIVLLGNSITLTPGTVTVEVNSPELVVHAMDDKSAEDVTNRRMEREIVGLFIQKGRE